MESFTVKIPFALQSKSNFQFSRNSKSAAQAAKLSLYEGVVRALISRECPDSWELGSADEPLASRPVVFLLISTASSHYDSANFTKSIADAAEGVVCHNDASIFYTITETQRVGKPAEFHTLLFGQLPPDSTVAERRLGLAELLAQLPTA